MSLFVFQVSTVEDPEKSVIAKIADDVTVGIKGKKIEIIVKKSFA